MTLGARRFTVKDLSGLPKCDLAAGGIYVDAIQDIEMEANHWLSMREVVYIGTTVSFGNRFYVYMSTKSRNQQQGS